MAASVNVNIGVRVEERFGLTPNEFQLKTLRALLREQDVFLSTRIGGGKSLCYHGFSCLWSELHGNERCLVLVFTPLISIMKEQCNYLVGKGYKAPYIGRLPHEDEAIQSGSIDFVFSSPENPLSVDRYSR